MKPIRTLLLSLVFATSSTASLAEAQDLLWGDLVISAGALEFDLAGTGVASSLSTRVTRNLTPHLVLEGRGMYAKSTEKFESSRLFVPEAQLQYRWTLARLTPFVGAGGGAVARRSEYAFSLDSQPLAGATDARVVVTDWAPAVSFSAGTGVRLTRQLGLLAEVRLRGVEWPFTGSVAEWGVGLGWRIPARSR